MEKDIHISGSIHRDGQWEGSRVKQLADLFIKQSDLEFLDLGCNIGAYTVALAHQGVKVTAVDPMLENLELLSRSLAVECYVNLERSFKQTSTNYISRPWR